MKKKYTLLFLLFLFSQTISSQTINCYAKVSAINGARTVLTLSNVNESFDTFEDGEEIVIMQMQDDVIGANTADIVSFGDLSSISSAGLYEVTTISSHTESAGLPTTITISVASTNTYNITANSSVQIISFRNMGTPTNYTTTANLSAITWDGNIGGVLALYIPGVFTLANNINTNALGFRGGAKSADDNTACSSTPYKSSSNIYGYKGEGIYKATDATFTNARAKILTGGGAGSANNGGGGGGGNYSDGGIGGPGWLCAATQGYGYGGISLSSVISVSRIFMGGGGGGGQQNNNVATAGAAGGGIILLKADQLVTSGACGSLIISANGGTAVLAGNDGAGGGGAAGSIVLEINSISISASCPLTIEANGGTGGSVNSGAHGGGGAGGQGFVAISVALPVTNLSVTALNGTSGCNDNSSPCTNFAGSSSGVSNSGISSSVTGPLPIELTRFTANPCEKEVCLDWTTLSEKNNDYFTIEKTKNGSDFEIVGIIDGTGNSSSTLNYSSIDKTPYEGLSYYRLKQTDFNGTFSYSNLEMVDFNSMDDFSMNVFPNPNDGENITISINANLGEEVLVVVFDGTGREIYSKVIVTGNDGENVYAFDTSEKLSSGIYLITATSDQRIYNKKMIVK